MIEEDVKAALDPLVGNRCYYMTAPFKTTRPFATYQFVGGRPSNTLCGNTIKQNHRIQINIWDEIVGSSGAQSITLMRQAAEILTQPPLRGVSQGGAQSVYDDTTRTFGARQDFSIWQ